MDTKEYGLEMKFCQGEAVVLGEGYEVAGYASLFGLTDQGGDIVEPGAYTKSLARIRAAGGSVKMLWQHDPTMPIGIWEVVTEDARGLYVKGRLLPEVAQAREAAALIGAGAIDGLSIGYRAISAVKDAKGLRRLTEVELWEVSLVTFPMLREARVGAKSERLTEAALSEIAEAFREAAADLSGR